MDSKYSLSMHVRQKTYRVARLTSAMPSGFRSCISSDCYGQISIRTADIAEPRAYLHQRKKLLDYKAAHIQHMQNVLMQMTGYDKCILSFLMVIFESFINIGISS